MVAFVRLEKRCICGKLSVCLHGRSSHGGGRYVLVGGCNAMLQNPPCHRSIPAALGESDSICLALRCYRIIIQTLFLISTPNFSIILYCWCPRFESSADPEKMEALAIFGGITGACTLGTELIRISRYLRKIVKSVKYARRDISKTAQEMSMFAGLLEDFLDICVGNSASNTEIYSLSESLISWTTSATHGLRKLLKKVRALISHPTKEYSRIEKLTAHVNWYFKRASVEYFRASLRVARESIQAFTNIRCIEKLEEQLAFLKQAVRDGTQRALEAKLQIKLEERIDMLQQKV